MKHTPEIIRFDQAWKREQERAKARREAKAMLLDSLTLVILIAGIYWAVMFLAVAMGGL